MRRRDFIRSATAAPVAGRIREDRRPAPVLPKSTVDYRTRPPFQRRPIFPPFIDKKDQLVRLDPHQGMRHLGLQISWRSTPVGGASRGLESWRIMDALAIAFKARWYAPSLDYGNGYRSPAFILAGDSQAALAAQRHEFQRVIADEYPGAPEEEWVAAGRIPSTVTKDQWRRLKTGDRLRMEALTPLQREFVRKSMALRMRLDGDPMGGRIPPQVQPTLSLVNRGSYPGAPLSLLLQWQVSERHPLSSEDWCVREAPDGSFSVVDPIEEQLRDSSNIFWPQAELPIGDRDLVAPPDYRVDPRLQRSLWNSVRRRGIEEFMDGLSRFANLAFVMQGDWLLREDRASPDTRSGRDVMVWLAELARAEWIWTSGVWALRPLDPL